MELLVSLFFIIVLFFSVVIHEVAHGSMALSLGDPTAKHAGRLSLNPLVHIDPFGTVLLPLFLFFTTGGQGPIFAWAKPVPVNPYNFNDQKWGELKVSLAGPFSNFIIGIIFGMIIRFFSLSEPLFIFFSIISLYNFALAIFNMIPIPPLDGYHVLFSFLPSANSGIKNFLRSYSLIILLVFMFAGGISLVFMGADALYGLFSGISQSVI